MTNAEATRIVSMLAAAYPRNAIGQDTLAVYVSQLVDLPYQAALESANDRIRTSPFFPTIAEIRCQVTEAQEVLPSLSEAIAEIHAGACTEYGPHSFSHPMIEATYRAFGHHALETGWAFMLPRVQAHFTELRETHLREANCLALPAAPDQRPTLPKATV